MKSKRKKLIKIIVFGLLVALFFNAICTWGIIFDCDGGFEWSARGVFEDILTDDDGFAFMGLGNFHLVENLNNPIVIIPLVFRVYGIEPPPYVICFTIRDNTETFEKIFIELVSIEYVDNEAIEHKINWEGKFKRIKTPFDNMESWKPSDFPEAYMDDKLPVTVDRRQSCNIRFVGYFVKKEGDKIPFDTTEHFEYKSHTWRVYPAIGSF
jgi:hypothetical protein